MFTVGYWGQDAENWIQKTLIPKDTNRTPWENTFPSGQVVECSLFLIQKDYLA